MKKHAMMFVFASGFLFTNIQLFADEKPDSPVRLSGYASFEESELVKGHLNMRFSNYAGPVSTPLWMENAKIGMCATTDVCDHLQIITALEGKLGFSLTTDYNPQEGYLQTELPHTEFTIQRGEGL